MSPEMRSRIEAAMIIAHCSKGPNKGHLKAQCPPMQTDAAAYWQAVKYVCNPLHVGMAHMIFMPKDQRELFDVTVELTKAARKGVKMAA